VLACAGAGAQPQSDWERQQEGRQWREGEVALPAAPRPADLLPFFVSAASDFRFFVDRAALSVGGDGVVRYTLVARSPQGAESVSFEGIRCSTREVRHYATGRADGTWLRHDTPWRRIEARSVQRWHNALAAEYFCPGGIPIGSAAEGADALRAGGHPRANHTRGS
jgi:hypothetical protein